MIGVIVESMNTPELAHTLLTRMEVTATIHQRKARMYELADGYMALPGGYGTLDELFETLTWAQIGEHSKPVGLLNVSGYYDDLLKMLDRAVKEKFLFPEHRRALLVRLRGRRCLLEMMEGYQTPVRGGEEVDEAGIKVFYGCVIHRRLLPSMWHTAARGRSMRMASGRMTRPSRMDETRVNVR